MADATVGNAQGDALVAYKLLVAIASAEDKGIFGETGGEKASRAWIIQTYAQCMQAVKHGIYDGRLTPVGGQVG